MHGGAEEIQASLIPITEKDASFFFLFRTYKERNNGNLRDELDLDMMRIRVVLFVIFISFRLISEIGPWLDFISRHARKEAGFVPVTY